MGEERSQVSHILSDVWSQFSQVWGCFNTWFNTWFARFPVFTQAMDINIGPNCGRTMGPDMNSSM